MLRFVIKIDLVWETVSTERGKRKLVIRRKKIAIKKGADGKWRDCSSL